MTRDDPGDFDGRTAGKVSSGGPASGYHHPKKLTVAGMPAGSVLLGRSGVVYVRRPDEDYQRDGLGEWRGTHGGILMNWQVQQDVECRLIPDTPDRCHECGGPLDENEYHVSEWADCYLATEERRMAERVAWRQDHMGEWNEATDAAEVEAMRLDQTRGTPYGG